MNTPDFTTAILVEETPIVTFNAINNVKGWWSEEIEGSTNKLNDEFRYHYEDVHRCKMRITEFIPGEKVIWLVLENYFKFTKTENEWVGNKIIFDISVQGDKTQVRMTQEGLGPQDECFEICRDAWTTYIQRSLRSLISTGKGMPNGKNKPQTKNEKKLTGQ